MINIAELLKDAPEGTELWCTLYGKVSFISISPNEHYPIQIRLSNNTKAKLDKYGRYYNHFEEGECILFPSKNCKTWEGWEVPTNSKFKVGDWVVFNNSHNSIYQISEVRAFLYMLTHIGGGEMSLSFSQRELLRPWTIEDAEKGDVLLDEGTNTIGIFEKICGTHWHSKIYCGTSDCSMVYETGGAHEIKDAKPATKEQCDLFFSKIKEAGYEWDEKKKEIRKIKPHYDITNFEPFDKVLVRDRNDEPWRIAFYGYYNEEAHYLHFVGTRCSKQCIPFNDKTKHLLGTTDMCPEEFINW